MVRAGRLYTATEYLSPAGVPVRLSGEVWWMVFAGPRGGAAFAYHRPSLVESGDTRISVTDFVGLARVLGLVLVSAAWLRRIKS